jgi:hypothetical protein
VSGAGSIGPGSVGPLCPSDVPSPYMMNSGVYIYINIYIYDFTYLIRLVYRINTSWIRKPNSQIRKQRPTCLREIFYNFWPTPAWKSRLPWLQLAMRDDNNAMHALICLNITEPMFFRNKKLSSHVYRELPF